ncbi:hypothetical protein [Lentzea fradiae]|uniref:hypothetical protein n=1 Tax=Lentzea fradiae TaxID=200378 RepID=UPI000A548387|nr:hypothetical protein [Lentzea fradiae]
MEFAEYVARQRPALMRFATVLTCRTWLAEDLVSDVLGRAFERWERISVMDEPHDTACRGGAGGGLRRRRRTGRARRDDQPPRGPAEETARGRGPALLQGAVLGTPGGRMLAPRPPMTLEQLKAIVTSGQW